MRFSIKFNKDHSSLQIWEPGPRLELLHRHQKMPSCSIRSHKFLWKENLSRKKTSYWKMQMRPNLFRSFLSSSVSPSWITAVTALCILNLLDTRNKIKYNWCLLKWMFIIHHTHTPRSEFLIYLRIKIIIKSHHLLQRF